MNESEVAEVEMAKPKKKTPPAEVPTGVRLSNELRAEVDEICARDGVLVAQFIRDAVQAQTLMRKPELVRRALVRSVGTTAGHFERALAIGVLNGTEAEEQAEDVRRFFDQLIELLKVEPEHEPEEA